MFQGSLKTGGAPITLRFAHSNARTRVMGADALSAKVNYFRGGPAHWHSEIATYRNVRYVALYPGIDAVFHEGPSASTPLEFDMVAAPHARPQDIRLIFTAGKNSSVRILAHGDLTVAAGRQSIVFRKPSASDFPVNFGPVLRGGS